MSVMAAWKSMRSAASARTGSAMQHASWRAAERERQSMPMTATAWCMKRRREGDAAPLGIILRRVDLLLVIRRHILRAVARKSVHQSVLTGEVVAAIMQVHAAAVTRQSDIAAMGVHAGRRQHMRPVNGHALRLVDGGRIAVVDAVIVLQVEGHAAPVVSANRHGCCADILDGAKRAVLDAKAALVSQEHDAIPGGEVSFAALDGHAHVLAKIASLAHPVAGRLVEFAHLRIGVGE